MVKHKLCLSLDLPRFASWEALLAQQVLYLHRIGLSLSCLNLKILNMSNASCILLLQG